MLCWSCLLISAARGHSYLCLLLVPKQPIQTQLLLHPGGQAAAANCSPANPEVLPPPAGYWDQGMTSRLYRGTTQCSCLGSLNWNLEGLRLSSQKLGVVVCTCNPGTDRQRHVDPGALLVCQSSCNGKLRLREKPCSQKWCGGRVAGLSAQSPLVCEFEDLSSNPLNTCKGGHSVMHL